MTMLLRPWIRLLVLVAVLTSVAGVLAQRFYAAGYRAAEARQAAVVARAQARLAQAAEALGRMEALRLAAEAERDAIADELEDAARLDAAGGNVALGIDSVRRLNRR